MDQIDQVVYIAYIFHNNIHSLKGLSYINKHKNINAERKFKGKYEGEARNE